MNYTPENATVIQSNGQRNESQTSGCNSFRAISDFFSQCFTQTNKQETSIAMKRLSKNPKQFTFKTLPLFCKYLVLDCADVGETLNFLKTDRYLRRHAMQYGPFRGKIDQILVVFDPFIETEERKFGLFPHFVLVVHLHKRTVAKILIADLIVKIGNDTLPNPKLGQYLWNLVNKTRYCKVVSIDPGFFHFRNNPEMTDQAIALKLEAEQESEAQLRKVFDGNRFLPRLRQTAIFRYHGAGMMSNKIFFDNFDRPVNDCFFMDLQWEDEENKEAQDYLEVLFNRPNYQQSKFYGFDRKPFTAQLWKSFSKTNMRMLMSEGLGWDDFKQSMKIFLELGIPSKDDDAVVEVRSRAIGLSNSTFQWEKTPEEVFEELMDLIYNFQGLEKINELSMEAKGIIEFDQKFIQRNKQHFEAPFKEEKVTAKHEDKAMYIKRINRERECVFMATITEKRGENFGYLDVRCVMKNLPSYRL